MTVLAGSVRDLPVAGARKLCGLTWAGEFLWFSESSAGRIMAIDPVSGEIAHQVPCSDIGTDLTTVAGKLLQVVGERRDLRLLDPETGEVLGEEPNPRPGCRLTGVEACRDGIWFGYSDLRLIDLRDTRTFRLLDCVRFQRPVGGVTVSDGFVVNAGPAAITLINPRERRELVSVSVYGEPAAVTWDGSLIWYCDAATLQLRAVELPGIQRA